MLTQAVREALEAELERLRIHRKRITEEIDQKIKALEAILSPMDALMFFQNPTLPMDLPERPKEKEEEGIEEATGNGSLAGMGLRGAIRTVLSYYPSGLRPTDLVEKMEEMGYRPGGKMSTKQLIYGELYRLMDKRKLVKTGAGKYKLHEHWEQPKLS